MPWCIKLTTFNNEKHKKTDISALFCGAFKHIKEIRFTQTWDVEKRGHY